MMLKQLKFPKENMFFSLLLFDNEVNLGVYFLFYKGLMFIWYLKILIKELF